MRRFHSIKLPSVHSRVLLNNEVSHHLLRVVGIAPLEQIELFDGEGRGCIALLFSVQNGLAEVAWVSELSDSLELPSLTLVLALTKGDAFGTALRMCTELGVDTFIPLQAQRSIPKGDKHARWSKIVSSASGQSKRLTIPNVLPLQTWKSIWEVVSTDLSHERWVLHTDFDKTVSINPIQNDTTLFIGPEGGFTEQELSWMVEQNCQYRTLGPLVLKADTAAIVASARALS